MTGIVLRCFKKSLPSLLDNVKITAFNGGVYNRVQFSTEESKDKPTEETDQDKKVGGFAKAFIKYTAPAEKPAEATYNFSSLLRESKFMDLGDPEGKIVVGEIIHIIDDDLYIDFGWKFNCVCSRPSKNGNEYVRGAKVRLMIKDLELSSRFLGSDTDLTLLEADCRLLNIVYTPVSRSQLATK